MIIDKKMLTFSTLFLMSTVFWLSITENSVKSPKVTFQTMTPNQIQVKTTSSTLINDKSLCKSVFEPACLVNR